MTHMPTIRKNQKTFLDTCENGESNTSRIYRIQIISRGNIFIKVAYLRATLHSCFSIVYRAKRQVHIAVQLCAPPGPYTVWNLELASSYTGRQSRLDSPISATI